MESAQFGKRTVNFSSSIIRVDIGKYFGDILHRSPDVSIPVAAIQALSESIQHSPANTMSEFIKQLEVNTTKLEQLTDKCLSVAAGCELFRRVVTRAAADSTEDFCTFKSRLAERGKAFAQRSVQCREKIADLAIDFIQDGNKILIHSYSRVVMILLLRAAQMNRRFSVFVTEARPTSKGFKAASTLRQHGIPATVILDSAVGFYMEKVDMVLVGAEGVVENGGIINQIGTYQMAVMAKSANIPFYAVAESYKFVREFPLDQYDLPTTVSSVILQESKLGIATANLGIACLSNEGADLNDNGAAGQLLEIHHPSVDYTPPAYICLLFTDLGVLTPSGVSDELIKLYY